MNEKLRFDMTDEEVCDALNQDPDSCPDCGSGELQMYTYEISPRRIKMKCKNCFLMWIEDWKLDPTQWSSPENQLIYAHVI